MSESHSVTSDFATPWNSPGQNTGVGNHSLLLGIFPTQGSNPGLPTLQVGYLPSEPPGKPEENCESESQSVVSNSLKPHGLYSPWNSPGQNTRVGSLCLLLGIFPTQGSNPGLPHCRQIIYQLSHKGSQIFYISSDNKCIKSRINMVFYLAKDLEFIWGSGHGKGCNLKVILRY